MLCVASGSSSDAADDLPFSLSCVFQRRATGARKPAASIDRQAVEQRPGELLGEVVSRRHVRAARGDDRARRRDRRLDLRVASVEMPARSSRPVSSDSE